MNEVVNGDSKKVKSTSPISQNKISFNSNGSGQLKLTNESSKKLFVKLQLSGIPLNGDKTSKESNLQMTVKYMDLQENPIDPTVIEQGTDFIAEVDIFHPGVKPHYTEMALTQLFPSGWEIRNTRMDVSASTLLKSVPDYQDFRDVFESSDTMRIVLESAPIAIVRDEEIGFLGGMEIVKKLLN